jgi:hypothetical protein
MSHLTVSLLLASFALTARAAELPPLDATVQYDSKTITHSGVTETRQVRNTLIRRPGHVWMERVLPEHTEAGHVHTDAKGGHKHIDFDISSQHLTRDAKGEIRAEYIDPEQRQVVFVPAAEYNVSGFDGSWDNAAELVAEKTVKAMPLSKRASAVANAEWREDARNGWYNRILWSNQHKIALVIESGKSDGTTTRRTTVELKPVTPDAALPWKRLAGYAQKEYDDFMD